MSDPQDLRVPHIKIMWNISVDFGKQCLWFMGMLHHLSRNTDIVCDSTQENELLPES